VSQQADLARSEALEASASVSIDIAEIGSAERNRQAGFMMDGLANLTNTRRTPFSSIKKGGPIKILIEAW